MAGSLRSSVSPSSYSTSHVPSACTWVTAPAYQSSPPPKAPRILWPRANTPFSWFAWPLGVLASAASTSARALASTSAAFLAAASADCSADCSADSTSGPLGRFSAGVESESAFCCGSCELGSEEAFRFWAMSSAKLSTRTWAMFTSSFRFCRPAEPPAEAAAFGAAAALSASGGPTGGPTGDPRPLAALPPALPPTRSIKEPLAAAPLPLPSPPPAQVPAEGAVCMSG
mmetsp:Transcript_42848/g.96918  ORF Transcript_42848/g.96918 Transcript_42848/m.96918 type:complete len:229 (+) Transcript_42848:230-916(+)